MTMPVQIKHYRDMGEFCYGAAAQMTPLIRRVLCQNPTPFTYKGTGTYIVGTGRVAVIDPGPSLPSHVEDILAALRPDEEVTHICITHTHSDHSALTTRLQERTSAPAYGSGPHGAVRAFDPDDRVDFSKYFTAAEKAVVYEGTMELSSWDTPHKQLFKCQTVIGETFKHGWGILLVFDFKTLSMWIDTFPKCLVCINKIIDTSQ